MNPCRRALLALPAGLALPAARAQAIAPLRLGLAPYLSPAALFNTFRPVREHLERTLAQPVELLTARDFVALAAAVRSREYEIALLPAPAAKGYVTQRTTFYDDIGLTHHAGPVRRSYTFLRDPSRYSYHPAGVWTIDETRRDLWGNEWHRSLHGYFVMDDFGTLVPTGGAA